jgi:hypothetical protein
MHEIYDLKRRIPCEHDFRAGDIQFICFEGERAGRPIDYTCSQGVV